MGCMRLLVPSPQGNCLWRFAFACAAICSTCASRQSAPPSGEGTSLLKQTARLHNFVEPLGTGSRLQFKHIVRALANSYVVERVDVCYVVFLEQRN